MYAITREAQLRKHAARVYNSWRARLELEPSNLLDNRRPVAGFHPLPSLSRPHIRRISPLAIKEEGAKKASKKKATEAASTAVKPNKRQKA